MRLWALPPFFFYFSLLGRVFVCVAFFRANLSLDDIPNGDAAKKQVLQHLRGW